MENIKILSILKSASKSKRANVHRDSNIFIIRVSGSVCYSFTNKSFDVHPNEMIFIPKDENYVFSKLTDTECKYVSIRFESDVMDTTPSVWSLQEFELLDEIIDNLEELWKFGSKAEHYKCYSIIYSLFSYIESRKELSASDRKKLDIISPAINYLKEHIYDNDLKVKTLNDICGISSVYFNKIFYENFGVSPQSFILSKRLIHAKTILDSGDFNTIYEIAESVGYNDPLYFSRAFKNKFGVSPQKYIKITYKK